MAFTTWTALRTAIKDALADHIAGEPCVGNYTIMGRTLQYKNFRELTDLYEKTYVLESMESTGNPASRVSYGRYRRLKAITS